MHKLVGRSTIMATTCSALVKVLLHSVLWCLQSFKCHDRMLDMVRQKAVKLDVVLSIVQ